jgi:hypothetical protein
LIADLGDDGWLMHRVGDGSTHLVDFVSGEVLLFVGDRPATTDEITAHLRAFLHDDSLTSSRVAEEILGRLIANGLLEDASA